MLLCIVVYAYNFNEPKVVPYRSQQFHTHYVSFVFGRNAVATGYTVEVTLPNKPLIDLVRRKIWL